MLTRRYLFLAAAGLCLFPCTEILAAPEKEQLTQETLALNDVRWQCMEYIRKGLDYPDRADFEYFGNFPAKKLADGSFSVEATYREDGSSPQKKANCTLKAEGAQGWNIRLESVTGH